MLTTVGIDSASQGTVERFGSRDARESGGGCRPFSTARTVSRRWYAPSAPEVIGSSRYSTPPHSLEREVGITPYNGSGVSSPARYLGIQPL